METVAVVAILPLLPAILSPRASANLYLLFKRDGVGIPSS